MQSEMEDFAPDAATCEADKTYASAWLSPVRFSGHRLHPGAK